MDIAVGIKPPVLQVSGPRKRDSSFISMGYA
jgi:hypothetical protein